MNKFVILYSNRLSLFSQSVICFVSGKKLDTHENHNLAVNIFSNWVKTGLISLFKFALNGSRILE